MSGRYLKPGFVVARLVNPLLMSFRAIPTLAVRGRTSGEWRTVPVNVLELDGNRSYVDLPPDIIRGLVEVTVEGWIRWDEFRAWSRFFSFGQGEKRLCAIGTHLIVRGHRDHEPIRSPRGLQRRLSGLNRDARVARRE